MSILKLQLDGRIDDAKDLIGINLDIDLSDQESPSMRLSSGDAISLVGNLDELVLYFSWEELDQLINYLGVVKRHIDILDAQRKHINREEYGI